MPICLRATISITLAPWMRSVTTQASPPAMTSVTSGTIEAGNNAILTSGTAAAAVAGDTPSGIFQTGGVITAAGVDSATATVALNAENVAKVAGAGSISQTAGIVSATNAASPVTVSMGSAGSISFGGTIFAGAPIYPGSASAPTGTVMLKAQNGDITETASGSSSPTGLVAANLLTASATGNVLLNTATGSGNNVINLGTSNAASGNFLLTDAATSGAALTVNGITAGGSIVLISAASVTQVAGTAIQAAGSSTATTPSLSITANGGAINQAAGATLAATNAGSGAVGLIAATNIVVDGNVSAASAGTTAVPSVALTAHSGSITQDTGIINAANGTVQFQSGGSITQGAGTINAANEAILFKSGGSITQGTGAINAANGSVQFQSGGSITQDTGIINAPNGTVQFQSGGSIGQNGTLIASVLTGGANGNASFNGATPSANGIATLGNFSTTPAATFSLQDGVNLAIGGTVGGARILIDDGLNTLTLASGGLVVGGNPRPPGQAFPADAAPSPSNQNPGADLIAGNVVQSGAFSVSNGGGPSTMVVDVSNSATGNIAFDNGSGLQAPNTWLILRLNGGTASGTVNVANLDLIYGTASGSSTLTGTIGGISGSAAAGTANIYQGSNDFANPNANFRFNACPIHSVNCVLLPTLSLPTANPLNDIDFSSNLTPEEEQELLLPIISYRDH